MLRAALRYPIRGERGYERVLVGGGLALASAFVPLVPLVFVAGYVVRVLSHTGGGGGDALRDVPPGFDGVLDLFRDGLAAVVVGAAYLLVPAAVLAVTVGGLLGGDADVATPGAATGVLVGSTAALALAVAFVYPLPAALVGYATRRRLRAAFDVGLLLRAAGDGRYLFAWLVGVAALGTAAALFGPLNALALGFFLAFYAAAVAAALVGTATAPAVRATGGEAAEGNGATGAGRSGPGPGGAE